MNEWILFSTASSIAVCSDVIFDILSSSRTMLQQYNAPSHWARETVALLSVKTPAFIPPSLWPPNSPDLNPVDHKAVILRNTRQRLATWKSCVNTSRIWDQFDQRVIDRAVQEWRIRLRACVKAKGSYFEQTLYTDSGNVDFGIIMFTSSCCNSLWV